MLKMHEHTHRHTQTHTGAHTDTQTHRQTDTQKHRHRERERERQRERETERDRERERESPVLPPLCVFCRRKKNVEIFVKMEVSLTSRIEYSSQPLLLIYRAAGTIPDTFTYCASATAP